MRAMVDESLLELWREVLNRAIYDLHGEDPCTELTRCRYLRANALAWFSSRSYEPGSFLWVCDILGLEASAVRREVFRSAAVPDVQRLEQLSKQRAAIQPALGHSPDQDQSSDHVDTRRASIRRLRPRRRSARARQSIAPAQAS